MLVVGAELDASEAEDVDRALDLLDRVGLVGVDREKADQLVGIGPGEGGGSIVDVVGVVHRAGLLLWAVLAPDSEDAGLRHRRHRRDLGLPGDGGLDRLIRTQLRELRARAAGLLAK